MSSAKQEDAYTTGRHSIAVVSRRTGISQLLLRAWERRYGAVEPSRTDTARRMYSDRDLEKLTLLRLLTNGGHRIGDVGRLSLEDLRELAEESGVTSQVVVPEPLDGPVDPAVLLEEALQAISNFDDRGLESTLDKALLHLSKPLLRKELISPLLNEIGERWRDGRLRISQEHMATAIVSAFLSAINTRYQVLPGAPLVTVATPSGHFHELGALLAAANAYEAGWDVLYLGPNIPAEEIALAAQSRGVRAVMLSLIFPGGDPAVATQLRELRRLVGPAMPIIAGGQAVPSYQGVLAEIGAITVVSTEQLGAALGSI